MKRKIIAYSIALLLLFALCACSASQRSNAEDPPPSEEPTPVENLVGDTAELGDWSITLEAFEFLDRIDSSFNTYAAPDEGCRFGVVSLSVKNNATRTASFLPTFSTSSSVRAKIMCGEYEFSATNLLAHSEDLHDETLNPLVTLSGIIAFNIPESVAGGADPLMLVLTESKNTLEFTLR